MGQGSGMGSPLHVLHGRAVQMLQGYMLADETQKTRILRELACIVVDIRGQFETASGSPAWLGRTYRYRREIGSIFSEANVPSDQTVTVQNALRYHISNVLRERLSDEELEELGLRRVSARERSVEKRQEQSKLLAAARERAHVECPCCNTQTTGEWIPDH